MSNQIRTIWNEVKSAPSGAASAINAWIAGMGNPVQRRDYWAGVSALLVMLMTAAWTIFFESVPARGIQFLLLAMLVANYILGFAQAPRARLWGFVFFLISFYYWTRETSKISAAVAGG